MRAKMYSTKAAPPKVTSEKNNVVLDGEQTKKKILCATGKPKNSSLHSPALAEESAKCIQSFYSLIIFKARVRHLARKLGCGQFSLHGCTHIAIARTVFLSFFFFVFVSNLVFVRPTAALLFENALDPRAQKLLR